MRIQTLLYCEADDADQRFCGQCAELFPTQPCQCLRFGNEKCVTLNRDPATNKPIRCDECRGAEDALLSWSGKQRGTANA